MRRSVALVLPLMLFATPAEAQSAPLRVEVSPRGVTVGGRTADVVYPATNLISLFGTPSRSWSPTGGVPVRVAFFDPLGVSIRQPANDEAKFNASVLPMLELRCETDGSEYEVHTRYTGVISVNGAEVRCGMNFAQVRNALATGHQPASLDPTIFWLRTFTGAYKVSFEFSTFGQAPPPTDPLTYVSVEKKAS